ncbi:hypothetical protein AB205_0094090 [Aquarana catesbeiana]|uniref:Uncharacterized protein n=1 Tax=Aquarana catesbeiana TaxID=8400 RepID=A0A2G9SGX7_AQUCT|nr:hypothetical protein AB205_0094090 [Aquarana catesbeiana]
MVTVETLVAVVVELECPTVETTTRILEEGEAIVVSKTILRGTTSGSNRVLPFCMISLKNSLTDSIAGKFIGK